MKKSIHFKLFPEMIAKLKTEAEANRRPTTTQLEIIIEEYFKNKDNKN